MKAERAAPVSVRLRASALQSRIRWRCASCAGEAARAARAGAGAASVVVVAAARLRRAARAGRVVSAVLAPPPVVAVVPADCAQASIGSSNTVAIKMFRMTRSPVCPAILSHNPGVFNLPGYPRCE